MFVVYTDPSLNPIVSVSQNVCSNESDECIVIVILHNLVEYVFHHISTQNNTLSKTRMEYKMNILWQFSSLLHLYVVPTLIERPASCHLSNYANWKRHIEAFAQPRDTTAAQ